MGGGFRFTIKRAFVYGTAFILGATALAFAQNAQSGSHAITEEGGLGNPATIPSPGAPATSTSDYIIGPGDLLSINVMNEQDVSGKVPVRPDGMITVPLIGDVQASGLTPDKLQASITKKLTDYVKDPSVTVVVEEMNSRQFNVLGRVQHPGAFPLNKPTRVLDALALAGGFNEFAKKNKVYVLRRNASGNTVRLPFNYKKVAAGEDDNANIQLEAGDTVIVP